MAIWIALLVAPTLMLLDQSIAYAAAGWACKHQNLLTLHGVHALFLVCTLAAAFMAWQRWQMTRGEPDETTRDRHFLSGVATASAAFSSLVIVAMWLPTWIVPSCLN